MREEESAYAISEGKPKGNRQLEDLGINARILKWILIQYDGRTIVKFVWRI